MRRILEVDSSYYAMPKPEVAELWAKGMPPDFTFNITGIQFKNGLRANDRVGAEGDGTCIAGCAQRPVD